MNPVLLAWIVFLCTSGGVATSLLVRWGRFPVWASLPFTLGTACLWAWQTRYGTMPLLQVSAIFDVVASTTWLVGLAAFGKEPVSLLQWVGIASISLGMLLVNSR